jgi:hypothetical protein
MSTDYAFRIQRTTVEVAMNKTPDELWLSFKALAKTYPHDDGVRITAQAGIGVSVPLSDAR